MLTILMLQETDYYYDDRGNLIRRVFADGTYSVTEYDSQDRVIGESEPVAEIVEARWSASQKMFYDATIGVSAIIPTRSMEYDSQGRLIEVRLPETDNPVDSSRIRPTYQYQYDDRGNQVVIRDPLGRETWFEFDEFGRQIRRTLPLGSVDPATFSEYSFYDDEGRQALHVSFEGIATYRTYDNVTGRMLTVEYFRNVDGSAISNLEDFDPPMDAAETISFTF